MNLSNFSLSNSALRHSLLKSVIRDSFRIDSVQINYTEKESLFLYPILIYFKELFILTHKIIRSQDPNIIFSDYSNENINGKIYKIYLAELIQPTCPYCRSTN